MIRVALADLFGPRPAREIKLHHNAQRKQCECGKVLELEPKTQRLVGRRREWTCGCGTTYWKPKVNFRGQG